MNCAAGLQRTWSEQIPLIEQLISFTAVAKAACGEVV
jgi:hypothetical protein